MKREHFARALERSMWADACDLLEKAERIRRSFFVPGRTLSGVDSWEPPVDVYETASDIRAMVALPGVARIAGIIDFKPAEKQSLLETFDIRARLDRLLQLMGERIEVLKLSRHIGERTQESITARQREHILREQLAQIRAERCVAWYCLWVV